MGAAKGHGRVLKGWGRSKSFTGPAGVRRAGEQ